MWGQKEKKKCREREEESHHGTGRKMTGSFSPTHACPHLIFAWPLRWAEKWEDVRGMTRKDHDERVIR